MYFYFLISLISNGIVIFVFTDDRITRTKWNQQEQVNLQLKHEVRRLKHNLAQTRRRYKARLSAEQTKVKDITKELEKLQKDNDNGKITSADLKKSATLQEFHKNQMRLSKNRPKGRRYTNKDKIFAISLYYQSPKSYRQSRNLFYLPTPRTIRRWLEGMEFESGFKSDILNILQKRVDKMSEKEKLCVLLVDEISLKEGLNYNESKDMVEGLEDFGLLGRTKQTANQGLVFMVRGLTTNWKQPIAYFFAQGTTPEANLATLLRQCIRKLFDMGLTVKVCIGDQGVGNRGAFNILGISETRPYIEMNNQKVYFMYDPPHLLKSVRNNLQTHDFEINGKLVKWDYIKQYYLNEKRRGNTGLRASHKLTDKHINLPPFSKMSVSLAAQTLSHSVAAGINMSVATKTLPPEAAYTAEFCERMDQLFDSVNSRKKKTPDFRSKPLKAGVTSSSGHMKFWKESLQWIRSWRIDSQSIQCVKGWILSLTVLILLWTELRDVWGFSFFLVSRCNQDCLENLFSVVRQKGGSNDCPQCNQFQNCLKAAVVDRLVRPVGRNCRFIPEDGNDKEFIDHLLEKTKKVKAKSVPQVHDDNVEELANVNGISNARDSHSAIERGIGEENVLVYICGYICHKVLFTHECSQCRSAMVRAEAVLDSPNLLLTHFKAMTVEGSDFGLLTVPTAAFISFLAAADSVFKRQYHISFHSTHLGASIKRCIRAKTTELQAQLALCPSILDSVIALFVRMRIHHALKHYNKTLRATKRKNRKYLKVSHLYIYFPWQISQFGWLYHHHCPSISMEAVYIPASCIFGG